MAVQFYELFAANGGLATTRQVLAVISRKELADYLKAGALFRVWHGVYALEPPDTLIRLRALELATGKPIVACMGTAAELHGFDIEQDSRLHVLDPNVRIRPTADLMVHQRSGALLSRAQGRLVTAPAWTAVEVARTVNRRRVLANLDAALRSGTCSAVELGRAVDEQAGRRGIVAVRNLLPYADSRAESPMESEARLVFLDGGLPTPVLQHEIVDRCGQLWRVDFAWPEAMVVAGVRQHGVARQPRGMEARSHQGSAAGGMRVERRPVCRRRCPSVSGRSRRPGRQSTVCPSPPRLSRRKRLQSPGVSGTFMSARGGGGTKGAC